MSTKWDFVDFVKQICHKLSHWLNIDSESGATMPDNGHNGQRHWIERAQLTAMLRARARELGAVNKLAVQLGITGQYMDCILNGKKSPGPKLLKALQLRKVVVYEPIVEEAE